jgi:hypothetical protein
MPVAINYGANFYSAGLTGVLIMNPSLSILIKTLISTSIIGLFTVSQAGFTLFISKNVMPEKHPHLSSIIYILNSNVFHLKSCINYFVLSLLLAV